VAPRPWRRAGRIRVPDGPVHPSEAATGPTGSKGSDQAQTGPGPLLELAAEQATGALYTNGPWNGAVYLVRGRIGYVESVLTPGLEALLLRPTYTDEQGTNEQGWAQVVQPLRRGERKDAVSAAAALLRQTNRSFDTEILRRTALADAALATLGSTAPDTTPARVRFRPGIGHWYPPARTFSVAEMLAEVDRRESLLAHLTLGIQPDRVVQRVAELPFERIRLTATQWNIARLADGRSTPLDIAWMLGHGVFATTLAVHQLARLGVISTDLDASDPKELDGSNPESSNIDLAERHSRPAVPARHVLSFLRAATHPDPAAITGKDLV